MYRTLFVRFVFILYTKVLILNLWSTVYKEHFLLFESIFKGASLVTMAKLSLAFAFGDTELTLSKIQTMDKSKHWERGRAIGTPITARGKVKFNHCGRRGGNFSQSSIEPYHVI